MEGNMKHRVRIVGATLAVLLLAALPLQLGTSQLAAQTPTPAPDQQVQRTIAVSGTGQVSATPDTVVVTIGVETQAPEASQAMSDNSQEMSAVVSALEDAGVASKDIQTQVVQLQPQYKQSSPGATTPVTPTLVGYVATNLVQVRTQELDTLGQLLDAAVQAGANRIQSISFEVSDSAALLDQAREAAWTDAEHKASQLAELAGAQLGEVITITESSQPPAPIVERAAVPSGAGGVPIEPGTQTVQVSVQVTWQLK
jgi:uncharacterized protein YggE